MSGPNEIDIEVQANAAEAVRASNDAARALTGLINQVGQLEGRLRQLFSGQIPQDMKQLEAYVKQITTAASAAQYQPRAVTRAVNTLASGGPATAINNAAFRGVIANLQSDPALQALKYEKEAQKVAEARLEIYRRIREALPDDASERQVVARYRQALTGLGVQKDNARTLSEARAFHQQLLDEQSSASARQAEKDFKYTQGLRVRYFAQEQRDREQAEAAALRREEQSQKYIQTLKTRYFGQQQREEQAAEAAANRRAERNASYVQGVKIRYFTQQQREEEKAEAAATRQAQKNADYIQQLKIRYFTEQQRLEQQEERRRLAAERKANASSPVAIQDRASESWRFTNARLSSNGGFDLFATQARIMANYSAMSGVLGAISFAGRSVVDFEKGLKDLQAIAAATNGQMVELKKTILDIANDSKFSVGEITEATKILAQAGYSTEQISSTLRSVINLATASGSSTAEAAQNITTVLSAFDLSMERSTEVANIMTAGLNKSKLSMDQLTLGLQYAGNYAAQSNVQFEEVVAALGAMANAGIKSGSTLGTGLRQLLIELDHPSKKFLEVLGKVGLTEADVDVKSQGLAGALQNLTTHGFTASDAMAAFDKRAGAAFAALSNNIGVMGDLQSSIVGTDAATRAATTQMDSFAARWQQLQNNFVAIVQVAGSPLLNFLKLVTGGLKDVLQFVAKLGPVLQVLTTAMVTLTGVAIVRWLGGLVLGMLAATGATNSWALAITAAALRAGQFGVALEGMAISVRSLGVAMAANPATLLILGLTTLISLMGYFSNTQSALNEQLDKYQQAASAAQAKSQDYQSRISELDKFVETLSARHERLSKNTYEAGAAADQAAGKFGQWGVVLDAQARKVDNLIARLLDARRQMAALGLAESIKERDALQGQSNTLQRSTDGQINSLLENLKVYIGDGAFGRGNQVQINSGAQALFKEIRAKGKAATGQDILNWQSRARTILDQTKGGGVSGMLARNRLSNVLSYLDEIAPNRVQLQGVNAQLSRSNIEIGERTLETNPAITGLQQSALTLDQQYRSRLAAASAIKDPKAKVAAQVAAETFLRENYKQLQAEINATVPKLLSDPQARAGLAAQAQQQGITIEQAARNSIYNRNPTLQTLAVDSGSESIGAPNPAVLKSRARALEARAKLAKKAGNTAEYKRLRDEALRLKQQAIGADPNLSADDAQAEIDALADQTDADTQRSLLGGGGGGAARRGLRNSAATSKADAGALKRQIENLAAGLGPNGEDLIAGQQQLVDLLNSWKAAREAEIRDTAAAGRASPEDLAERLKAFQVEAKDYINKITNGNLAAAAQLMANMAQQAADDTEARVQGSLRNGNGDLQSGLKEVQSATEEALKKQIEAIEAAAKAQNADIDPAKAHEAQEQIRRLKRQAAQAAVDSYLKTLDAYFQGEADRLARETTARDLEIDKARSQNAAYGNAYGSRHIGDVHREAVARNNEQLDIRQTIVDRDNIQGQYNQVLARRNDVAIKYAQTTDPEAAKKLLDEWNALDKQVEDLGVQLQKANNQVDAMTAKAPAFHSLGEAIGAAADSWAEHAHATQPVLEQIADSMTGVFDNASSSMQTFLKNVETGTGSIGDAFKGMATSILGTVLDMVNKIIAQKILTWFLSAFHLGGPSSFGPTSGPDGLGSLLGSGGGSFGGLGNIFSSIGSGISNIFSSIFSFLPFRQGGLVPGMAGGGAVTGGVPNRDSVLRWLMPGEVVIQKSAVEMAGEENLLHLNAMGNRRFSEVRAASGNLRPGAPGAPTNVYVVAPETKPPMTKRDVVVAITDDMLNNGQTKKLVRAIATGQA